VTGTANLLGAWRLSLVPNAYMDAVSATAQFAIQQARQLAKNLTRASLTLRRSRSVFIREACLPPLAIATPSPVIYGANYPAFSLGFMAGNYLAKLPTIQPQARVAISWAVGIPFPPNIVQLGLVEKAAGKKQNRTSQGQFLTTTVLMNIKT